jgi:hypothetical protein
MASGSPLGVARRPPTRRPAVDAGGQRARLLRPDSDGRRAGPPRTRSRDARRRPAVGHHRLPRGAGRADAGGRPARRPPRPTTAVPRGPRAVRRRHGHLRVGPDPRDPDRRPLRPGRGGRVRAADGVGGNDERGRRRRPRLGDRPAVDGRDELPRPRADHRRCPAPHRPLADPVRGPAPGGHLRVRRGVALAPRPARAEPPTVLGRNGRAPPLGAPADGPRHLPAPSGGGRRSVRWPSVS